MNQGLGGNRILHDIRGDSGLRRFDRDVLAQPGVTHVIVLLGTNDMRNRWAKPEEEVTADTMIAGLKQMALRAHARGIKIFAGTLTPFENETFLLGAWTPRTRSRAAGRERLDPRGGAFDAVVDFDAGMRDPEHPARMLPIYDCGDHLHPSDSATTGWATSSTCRCSIEPAVPPRSVASPGRSRKVPRGRASPAGPCDKPIKSGRGTLDEIWYTQYHLAKFSRPLDLLGHRACARSAATVGPVTDRSRRGPHPEGRADPDRRHWVLSGADTALGLDEKRGVEIAFKDIGGKVLGHPLKLNAEDDTCNAEGGQTAATKLAANPQTVVVLGPACSSAATPGAPILWQQGIIDICTACTAPGADRAGPQARVRRLRPHRVQRQRAGQGRRHLRRTRC